MSTQAQLDDVRRAIAAAETVFDNHDHAVKWLNQPVHAFAGKTPLQLIADGRTDDVVGYLESIQSGFIG